MASVPFIVINGREQISLAQAFRYLRTSGQLDAVMGEILRQYTLEQTFKDQSEWAIAPAEIQATLQALRDQNGLSDPVVFHNWLDSQQLDEPLLAQRIEFDLKLNRLKARLADAHLQEYFIERKLELDQVVLSRILVGDRDLADELRQQLDEGANFETLAHDYSISDERHFNGMMGLLSRGNLPDVLRATIDVAQPGDVIGPLEIDGTWSLFRLENYLPATLDDPQVQQLLQNELLDDWVLQQLNQMEIEVLVGEEVSVDEL